MSGFVTLRNKKESIFVTERNKIPMDSGVDKAPEIIGNENVGTKCGFVGGWVEAGVVSLGIFGTLPAPVRGVL